MDIGADNDPYLDRLRIIQTPWFGWYLHHIHREDRESAPHDHPWWFISIILAGAYWEDVFDDKTDTHRRSRYRGRFSIRTLRRKQAHMITQAYGPLWTMVFTGRRSSDWGFYPNGQFVPWQEYSE
jgi:hypothetical protein